MSGKQQCTAKSKRTGERCKRYVTGGGTVCKWHGGKSTGPKTPRGKRVGAANSIKHGLYAKNYSVADMEFVSGNENVLIQSLDNELIVAKIRLNRALTEANRVINDPKLLDITDYITTAEIGESSQGLIDKAVTEIRHKRPDMWVLVDRCLRTVVQVAEARARIQEARDMQIEVERLHEEHRQYVAAEKERWGRNA